MRTFVRRALVLALVCTGSSAGAQARGATPLSVTLGLIAQSVPDAFSSRCGRENSGSVGSGVSAGLLRRLGRGFGVQADAQLLMGSMRMGCITNLPIHTISPTEYETRPGVDYPNALPHRRYASTTLRAVYEVRLWRPILRATAGGGALWAARPAPVGVASLGLAARGGRVRAFGDIEYAVSRVPASERRERFELDSYTVGYRSLGVTTVRLVRVPRWTTVRAGVELPVGARD
ncbi:MAG: hypothetical protein ACXW61_15765 [Gemmatirosa sp.]